MLQWNDFFYGCLYFNTQYSEGDEPAPDSWAARITGELYEYVLVFSSWLLLGGLWSIFGKTGHSNVMRNEAFIHNKTYRSFDFYVLLFFLVSFFGWLWEGAIYLFARQSLVNRGVYLGPYLPIYGAGGLLLWFLLHRLSKKPVLTFLLSALVCSALEYAVSFCLEKMWGLRWWDYSGWLLNINGRVCLAGAVAFGLGGMALNCFLMPYYMRAYHRLSRNWRIALSLLILAVFILDATYCAIKPHMGDNVSYGSR